MGWGTGRCRSTVASLGVGITRDSAGCRAAPHYTATWPTSGGGPHPASSTAGLVLSSCPTRKTRLTTACVSWLFSSASEAFRARKRGLSARAPLAHAMQHSALGTGWLTPWREDYMVFVYLLVAMLGVGAAIFAVQNPDLVAVHFLSWRTAELPVSLIILLSAFVGIVAASISAFAQQIQLERRIRKLQRRLAELSVSETSPPYIVP